MSDISIDQIGSVAAVLAVWITPSLLLSQQISQLAQQQRDDHKQVVNLILQLQGFKTEPTKATKEAEAMP